MAGVIDLLVVSAVGVTNHLSAGVMYLLSSLLLFSLRSTHFALGPFFIGEFESLPGKFCRHHIPCLQGKKKEVSQVASSFRHVNV